jgi:hypothetical protein
MITLSEGFDIDVAWLIKLVVALFGAILFLQTGFDKIMDWHGNETYFKSHFAKSSIAPWITLVLPVLTLLEVGTGIACAFGTIMLYTNTDHTAFVGIMLCTITILALFLGQRIAKDYAGAGGLIPYLLVFLFGLFMYMQ